MTRALLWMLALGLCALCTFAVVNSVRRPDRHDGDALLVRAPDGRCWRAHGRVEYSNRVLSWRTDSGPRVRVAGADWIEVARDGGVGGQGLDWRGAAAVLGVDLGACLPVAGSAP